MCLILPSAANSPTSMMEMIVSPSPISPWASNAQAAWAPQTAGPCTMRTVERSASWWVSSQKAPSSSLPWRGAAPTGSSSTASAVNRSSHPSRSPAPKVSWYRLIVARMGSSPDTMAFLSDSELAGGAAGHEGEVEVRLDAGRGFTDVGNGVHAVHGGGDHASVAGQPLL